MRTKAKTASPATSPVVLPVANSWFIPPLTLETRLVRIQALGQRIAGHIAFICGVTNLRVLPPRRSKKPWRSSTNACSPLKGN
jgi:hypothetical protein